MRRLVLVGGWRRARRRRRWWRKLRSPDAHVFCILWRQRQTPVVESVSGAAPPSPSLHARLLRRDLLTLHTHSLPSHPPTLTSVCRLPLQAHTLARSVRKIEPNIGGECGHDSPRQPSQDRLTFYGLRFPPSEAPETSWGRWFWDESGGMFGRVSSSRLAADMFTRPCCV